MAGTTWDGIDTFWEPTLYLVFDSSADSFINPGRETTYASVDTEQNPGYSTVNPAQEPVWQQIET